MDKIYFKDMIEEDFRVGPSPIPESIRKHRNLAIVLIVVQLLFAFASLLVYMRRNSRVILAADVISILLCFIGLFGTILVNSCMMFLHCFFCVSIFGAFYVYLIVEMLFLRPPSSSQIKNPPS
jgi:hypothetical protein